MKTLRNKLRQMRNHLSMTEQQQHSRQIIKQIVACPLYQQATTLACYLAIDGEVALDQLLPHLERDSKKCYLPVILSKNPAIMKFAPYHKNTPLEKKEFSILEPIYNKKSLKIAPQLDLILTPLVAFDQQGNRMGMGGGFYDRALQHLSIHQLSIHQQQKSLSIKPKLLGIAHELQGVEHLNIEQWDIPLDAIVTEQRLHYF
jgi:5-formyltetrahydrofolate cyclo-ligase